MPLSCFDCDSAPKSSLTKHSRRGSRLLRLKIWQSRSKHTSTRPFGSSLENTPLPIDSQQLEPSWTIFSFSSPEWTQRWLDLREHCQVQHAQKPHRKNRKLVSNKIDCDNLSAAIKNLSLSSKVDYGKSNAAKDDLSQTETPLWTVKAGDISSDIFHVASVKMQPFRLLDLPRELRDHILGFALTNLSPDDERVPIHIFHERKGDRRMLLSRVSPSISALLSSNRQILHEGLPMFYRRNKFYIRGITSVKALDRLNPFALGNIQHLHLILAKSTSLVLELWLIIKGLGSLPRLREAEIRMPCIDFYMSFLDSLSNRTSHGNNNSGSNTPTAGNATCNDLLAGHDCPKCGERPSPEPAAYELLCSDTYFKIDFCTPNDRSNCTGAAHKCIICAGTSALTETHKQVEEQRQKIDILWKKDPRGERPRPEIPVVRAHVCRSGLGPGASTTDTSGPLRQPLLLPSLKDHQSLRLATEQLSKE